MTRTYDQGPHSRAVWESAAATIREIEGLEFLDQLASGDLDPRAFVQYILPDSLYLEGCAKAMSLLDPQCRRRGRCRAGHARGSAGG